MLINLPKEKFEKNFTEINVEINFKYQSPINLRWNIPNPCRPLLNDLGDAYLVSNIFLAMQKGEDLHLRGSCSQTLIQNLEYFMEIWSCWKPEVYKQIKITADFETDEDKKKTEVFFYFLVELMLLSHC